MLMTYRRSGVELEVLAPGPLRRPRRGARSVGSQAGASWAVSTAALSGSAGNLLVRILPVLLHRQPCIAWPGVVSVSRAAAWPLAHAIFLQYCGNSHWACSAERQHGDHYNGIPICWRSE